MNAEKFRRDYPDLFFLSVEEPLFLSEYLQRIGVLAEDERVEKLSRAGDGNMNLTLRARTASRTMIVKQSRPWVERYPEIAAPWDRVLAEARFYHLVSRRPEISARTPRVLEVDPRSHVLVTEDFGDATDFTLVYRNARLTPGEVAELADWLSRLHRLEFADKSRASLTNLPMRRLNHEHLFRFPLADNALDLDAITPGLREAADELSADTEYVERVAALGKTYLSPGRSLLHGDYFPGSWLRTEAGFAVIDPEFAFFGRPEFDVGVLLAHLYLAEQDEATHAAVLEAYATPEGFEWPLALRFCAVEIMRRLIGVAQLPIALDLEKKKALLHLSRALVLCGNPLSVHGCFSVAARG